VEIIKFPKISQIRFSKLILHGLLLMTLLILISIITKNIIEFIFNVNFPEGNGPASSLVTIWAFFAIQNKKYQKEA